VNGLAVTLTCAVIALAADLFRAAGAMLYTEQYLAGLLALAMPLLFLHVPAEGGRARRTGPVPWYDVVAAAVACITSIYVLVRFPHLSELVSARPWDGLVPAAVLLVLVLEGLRRTTGIILTIVAACFFIVALVGGLLPGELEAKSIPFSRLTYYLVWDSSASLGMPLKIVSTVVVVYVLFGTVLFKAGGSRFFTDFSMALMGRYRGGPAKIAIVGSSLFGTISGSAVSNVLTTGVVTIPLMKQVGYRPAFAGAIEACASTGGQLMPPVMGIAAFIMAEFLQVPYADVALAALIPAILFYVALFIQVDLEAVRSNIAPIESSRIPDVRSVLRAGWHFPIPFAVLIYALFWRGYEAETAGLLATAVVLILAVVLPAGGKRIGIRDLYEMLRDTGLTVIDLFMIGVAAGIIIGSLNYSGVGFSLTLSLVHLGGGTLIGLLVVAAIASIVLGMGMPTVGVYILLATLIAPALVKMGIEPMAAHMFILYYGCLSMITPPVCIAAFAAANLAGSDPMRTGYLSMALGWTVFLIPFLFVYSGTLLMQGSPFSILLDFATAVAAVWLISASFMGYSVRFLGLLDRGIYFVAGACLMLPVGAFANARWFNIAGGVMAATLFVWERSRRRLAEPAPAAMAAAVTPSTPTPANPADRAFLDRMGVRGTGEGE
jgi:TRAP transporter 4TM/12TM fusion protein